MSMYPYVRIGFLDVPGCHTCRGAYTEFPKQSIRPRVPCPCGWLQAAAIHAFKGLTAEQRAGAAAGAERLVSRRRSSPFIYQRAERIMPICFSRAECLKSVCGMSLLLLLLHVRMAHRATTDG